MGFFGVLVWCAAALRLVRRDNSRFGVIKFPFSRQLKPAGKYLICAVAFDAERPLLGAIEKIRGSTGITGKSASRQSEWRRKLWRPFSVARAATELRR
jgi:hypothetical protein